MASSSLTLRAVTRLERMWIAKLHLLPSPQVRKHRHACKDHLTWREILTAHPNWQADWPVKWQCVQFIHRAGARIVESTEQPLASVQDSLTLSNLNNNPDYLQYEIDKILPAHVCKVRASWISHFGALQPWSRASTFSNWVHLSCTIFGQDQ